MAGLGSTSVINAAPGRVVIHTVGLRELSKIMSSVAIGDVPKVFAAEMKGAVEPIANLARGYARSIADSGDFAESIGITGGRSGVNLRSRDPGAGPIEFARPGNRYAPHGGDAPRSLFRAIDEGIDDASIKVAAAVERAVKAYTDRNYTSPDRAGA